MIFKSAEQRFEELYDGHATMVRGVLYNMTSEVYLDDLVQEVFVKVWQGLPHFQFKSSVRTWVYRVTINTAMDHLRKRVKAHHVESHIEAAAATSGGLMQVDIQRQMTQASPLLLVQQTLQEIDEETRSLITLFYFEDLKVKQIAEILQIPEGTVKSRMSSARETMKTKLIQKGVFDE